MRFCCWPVNSTMKYFKRRILNKRVFSQTFSFAPAATIPVFSLSSPWQKRFRVHAVKAVANYIQIVGAAAGVFLWPERKSGAFDSIDYAVAGALTVNAAVSAVVFFINCSLLDRLRRALIFFEQLRKSGCRRSFRSKTIYLRSRLRRRCNKYIPHRWL